MNAQPRTHRRAQYASEKKIAEMVAIGRKLGIDVAGFRVSPDGSIEVMENRAPVAIEPANDFDRFKDQL